MSLFINMPRQAVHIKPVHVRSESPVLQSKDTDEQILIQKIQHGFSRCSQHLKENFIEIAKIIFHGENYDRRLETLITNNFPFISVNDIESLKNVLSGKEISTSNPKRATISYFRGPYRLTAFHEILSELGCCGSAYDLQKLNTPLSLKQLIGFLIDRNIKMNWFGRKTALNLNYLDLRDLVDVIFSRLRTGPILMEGVNLSGVDFSTCRCSRDIVSLKNANLTYTRISNFDFEGIDIRSVNFSHARLAHIVFESDDGTPLNSTGCDFSHACFVDCVISDQNLKKFNFNSCVWEGGIIDNCTFAGADFTSAKLNGTFIRRSDFKDAIFDNTQITCPSFYEITISYDRYQNFEEMCDELFNHLANGQSFLTLIDGIDESYKELKVNLMEQMINQINNMQDDDNETKEDKFKTVLQFSASITDILGKNSIYLQGSQIIREFFENYLLPLLVDIANKNGANFSEFLKEMLLNLPLVTQAPVLDYNSNSGFFNQLFYAGEHSSNPQTKILARAQKVRYLYSLSRDVVRTAQGQLSLAGYDEQALSHFDEHMLLCSPDARHFILVHYDYYKKFVLLDESITTRKWDNLIYITQDPLGNVQVCPMSQMNFSIIFSHIELFKASYLSESYKHLFSGLLSALGINEPYLTHFEQATKCKAYPHKLISSAHQTALADIFKKNIQTPQFILDTGAESTKLLLTPEVFRKLGILYGFEEKTFNQQAIFLVSLAAIFAKLSSSSFFGTEPDSPTAIRNFAIALLNIARVLDGQLFLNGANEGIESWKNRLNGSNGVFTCTAVLWDMMVETLTRTPASKDIFSMLIPSVWR